MTRREDGFEETSYSLFWEAWWYEYQPDRERELRIGRDLFTDEGYGNGCVYEFFFREHILPNHGPAIRLEMFDDAFRAFHDKKLKKLWKELDGITSLEEVIELLDSLGIHDHTKRERD